MKKTFYRFTLPGGEKADKTPLREYPGFTGGRPEVTKKEKNTVEQKNNPSEPRRPHRRGQVKSATEPRAHGEPELWP